MHDLKIKHHVHFIFQEVWTQLTDYGEVIPGTEREETTYDGASHEMRHQFQFANPRKLKSICKLLECDDEYDADAYAIRVLGRFSWAHHKAV